MRLIDNLICLVCVSLVSLGQVLLRSAAKRAGGDTEGFFLRLISTPHILFGLLVYGVAMLLWLYILSRLPLSQAFAFFGLCFFLVPLLSRLILGDPIYLTTWIGASIICVGILITASNG